VNCRSRDDFRQDHHKRLQLLEFLIFRRSRPIMRHTCNVLSVLLLFASAAPEVLAKTLPEVQAMVESKASGALVAAEALTKGASNDANAWILLTRARLQADQAEKAIAAAEKATALGPKNAQAFYWLGNAYGSRIGEVGMLSKMTMAPKLRDAFEQAVKLDPALTDARSSLIEFYLQAPGAIGGGMDKAREQATAIAKYDRAQGLVSQARIAMHQKNWPQAIKHLEAARAIKPGDERIRLQLIVLYQESKRWADAYGAIKRWMDVEPGSNTAQYQLGKLAAVSGQYLAEGEAALRAYLKMPRKKGDPQPKNVQYRLGQVLAKAGRKDEARAAFQAALKLDPKFKDAKDALAAL
jgi:tetratricopeptide (TPR) repeat protein